MRSARVASRRHRRRRSRAATMTRAPPTAWTHRAATRTSNDGRGRTRATPPRTPRRLRRTPAEDARSRRTPPGRRGARGRGCTTSAPRRPSRRRRRIGRGSPGSASVTTEESASASPIARPTSAGPRPDRMARRLGGSQETLSAADTPPMALPEIRVVTLRSARFCSSSGSPRSSGSLVLTYLAWQVITWILIALFLAAALNPAVEALERRGMTRAAAAGVVFALTLLALRASGSSSSRPSSRRCPTSWMPCRTSSTT